MDVASGDHAHHHDHDHGIDCVSVRLGRPLERSRLLSWLRQLVVKRGETLLRAKGIVELAGADRKFVFQGVHMMMDTGLAQPWAEGEIRESRLVFIGRGLGREELTDALRLCQADA